MAKPAANGGLEVVGEKEIALSDHDLKAPKLMMGTLKVSDQVTVKYDLTLR